MDLSLESRKAPFSAPRLPPRPLVAASVFLPALVQFRRPSGNPISEDNTGSFVLACQSRPLLHARVRRPEAPASEPPTADDSAQGCVPRPLWVRESRVEGRTTLTQVPFEVETARLYGVLHRKLEG